MVRRGWVVALGLVAAGALAAPVPRTRAELLEAQWASGVDWEAQPVRGPLDPRAVQATPPYVPEHASAAQGEVHLPEGGAVAFWLDGLDVVRVRTTGPLEFERVSAAGPGEGQVRIAEEGIPARPGLYYLAEPMGGGSSWVVTAGAQARVTVERAVSQRTPWTREALRSALLAWIDGRGPLPALPHHPELRAALELDAELAQAMLAGAGEDAALRTAVVDWRKASALRAWAQVQSLTGPVARVRWLGLPGQATRLPGSDEPWRAVRDASGRHTVTVQGPGVLVLELRALVQGDETAARWVTVSQGSRIVQRASVRPLPARLPAETPAAFPAGAERLTTSSGETAGVETELRLPLGDGQHTLELGWDGGPSLWRGRMVQRRPWLEEVFRDEATWEDFTGRAEAALAGAGHPRAAFLRTRLSSMDGAPAVDGGLSRNPRLPAELRALAALDVFERDGTKRQLEHAVAALDGFGDPGGALAWHARIRTARGLVAAGSPDAAEELLVRAPGLPEAGWQLAELSELLAVLPAGEPLRSRELAALELAWRREPLSPRLRSAYAQAFWRGARWRPLVPAPAEGGSPLRALRFLDLEPPGTEPGPGALGAVTAQAPLTIEAKGTPTSPLLLRGYLLAGKTAGPVTLTVGDRHHPLVALGTLEPVELLLPPGKHALALQGAADARLLLDAAGPAAIDSSQPAYVRAHHPVQADGAAVRFRIPDPRVASPVRVQLRPLGDDSAPVTVWLHTDLGPARRLVLEPGSPSGAHLRLDGERFAGQAAAAVSAVVQLPPLAREVWFETQPKDAKVAVSLSVRRGDEGAAGEGLAAAELPADPVAEVLALSRQLAVAPASVELLFERAELLARLDEDVLAHQDVLRLLALQDRLGPAQARRMLALLRHLEAERTAVRLSRPLAAPALLVPALSSVPGAGEADLAAALARARQDGAEAKSPVDRYLRARLAAASGDPARGARELARLYADTGRMELAAESLALLERSIDAPAWRRWGAPLGAALSSELSAHGELPSVRRVSLAARRWVRWERLRDAESSVGRFEAEQDGAAEDRARALRKALLAPPWPLSETQVVRSGATAVLEAPTDGAHALGADALCVASHPGARTRCRFSLRVDGQPVTEQEVRAGQRARLSAEVRAAGVHQLEVALAEPAEGASGLVRFVDDASVPDARALATRSPVAYVRARAGEPVRLTVLGPASIRISARALLPSPAQRLAIGAGARKASLSLPAQPDVTIRRAAAPLGLEQSTVLALPDEGPQQLVFEPDQGEALVRVDLALPASPGARFVLAGGPELPLGADRLPWPVAPDALALLPDGKLAPAAPRLLGTLSAELGVAGEELEEDMAGALLPVRGGVDAVLGYRQELLHRRLWLRVSPRVRLPATLAPVYGGAVELHARRLPLGLRLTGEVAGDQQTVGAERRYQLRGSLLADRYFALSPDLGLIPGLRLAQTLHGGAVSIDPADFDRRVYSRFTARHRRRVSGWTQLRWQPVLDHFGAFTAFAATNADLKSLDELGAELRWSGLLWPWIPGLMASAAYEPSFRLADEHRGAAYLRHGVEARVEWTAWSGHQGRVLLFASERAHLSAPFGWQNLLSAGVRWDWTGGRGLRDFVPADEPFDELLDAGRP